MTNSAIFSPEQLQILETSKVPRHVAIIPDGNRRWAKQRNAFAEIGHRNGANVIIDVVKGAKELGIKVLTFYVFSTENWSRPRTEVAALMWLLQEFCKGQKQAMLDNGIKLCTIGELSTLPKRVLKAVNTTMEATRDCKAIDLVLAINYGSRDEICRAIARIAKDITDQKINASNINEQMVSKYLDTAIWPDPDLLIRTSGESRLSNFLLWQNSYAEIYVTDLLWPDFKPIHLLEAIQNFQQRERRLGGA